MQAIKIAFRGVVRNRNKSLLTTGATTLAAFVMIIFVSLANGVVDTLQKNAIRMQLSNAQAHAPGFRRDRDIHRVLEKSEEMIAAVEREGFRAAPRLYAYGLGAIDKASAGIEVRGIDEREKRVTEIAGHVREGSWIDVNDPRGAVIGKILAERLGAKIGSELMVLGQAADGSTANELLVVRGILRPVGDRVDRAAVIISAAKFRELFVLETGAHELAFAAADVERARKAALGVEPQAEIMTWRELEPAVARIADSAEASNVVLLFVTYAAVVIVVMNATLMSVFERIRQFGIMKAIGTTPGMITKIIFAEVMIQSVVALAIGSLFALPICIHLTKKGIDLSQLVDDVTVGGAALDTVWFGTMTPSVFLAPATIILLSAICASIYPGLKAAWIRPLEALTRR